MFFCNEELSLNREKLQFLLRMLSKCLLLSLSLPILRVRNGTFAPLKKANNVPLSLSLTRFSLFPFFLPSLHQPSIDLRMFLLIWNIWKFTKVFFKLHCIKKDWFPLMVLKWRICLIIFLLQLCLIKWLLAAYFQKENSDMFPHTLISISLPFSRRNLVKVSISLYHYQMPLHLFLPCSLYPFPCFKGQSWLDLTSGHLSKCWWCNHGLHDLLQNNDWANEIPLRNLELGNWETEAMSRDT